MKAKLHKLMGTAILGLALFSNTIPTWAGFANLPEVIIDTSSNTAIATGSTAGARYSKDSQQYIGCLTNSNDAGASFVTCYAVDKTGKALTCGSSAQSLLAAAKAMTDFSRITFFVNSDGYSCNSLGVENDSSYLK